MITMVGDREGDIYHLLANRPANVHLLVRSAQPRALTAGISARLLRRAARTGS